MSLTPEDVATIKQKLLEEVSIPNEVLDTKWFDDTIAFLVNEGFDFGYDEGRDSERFG